MIAYNGALQLFPLIRIAVMLTLGILIGDALAEHVHALVYLLLLGISITSFFFVRHQPLLSGTMVLSASLLFGAWLVSIKKSDLNACPVNTPLEYRAVIIDEPSVHGKVLKCNLLIVNCRQQTNLKPFIVRASILRDTITNRWRTLAIGKSIAARSVFSNNFKSVYSQHFRFERFMAAHHIKATTFIYYKNWQQTELSLAEQTQISVWSRLRLYLFDRRKQLIEQAWSHKMKGDNRALVESIALGARSALSKERREAYNVAGVSHVLALSGLHLGIIYTILSLLVSFLFRYLPSRGWANFCTQAITIPALWAYVFLVAMPPGAVRTAIMLSVYACISLLHRDRMSANSLALAGIVMLVGNPMLLWDISFQLSFAAVFSIFVFYPPLYSFGKQWLRGKICTALGALAAVSVAAQMGTAPLIVYYFGCFSTYFLFANIVIVPLVTMLLYVALLSLLLHPLVAVNQLCTAVLDALATAMNSIAAFFSTLPHAIMGRLQLNAIQVVLIYLLMACLYRLGSYGKRMYLANKHTYGL